MNLGAVGRDPDRTGYQGDDNGERFPRMAERGVVAAERQELEELSRWKKEEMKAATEKKPRRAHERWRPSRRTQ